MRRKTTNGDKGFSLVELIIAIAIMAVLVSIIALNLSKFVNKARKSMDLQTADMIARAAETAFAANPEAYELFTGWKENAVKVNLSATVNGVTENYAVYCVMTNEAPQYCFKGTVAKFGNKFGSSGFYKTINDELGLSTTEVNTKISPKYKIKKTGAHPKGGVYQNVDRWRICKRADNGQMEIWVADGSRWGGFPCFRL